MKIRGFFEHFEPYEWETPTHEIASRAGISPRKVVRLDTNTSPFIPRSSLSALAGKLRSLGVNQYPDTSYTEIRRLLSSYCKVGMDRFVITNGADEGLDIIAKTFLDPGDEALAVTPTYSMFRIITEIMGSKFATIPRKRDFGVDMEKVLDATSERTRVIFLCNPNNPTGNLTPVDEVAALAERTDAMVAVDEAYYELAGETAIKLTEDHPNIVVIRTFSKAFSMAGVRVGYLVAGEETVEKLNRVRPPNSVTVISLELAQHALRNVAEMRKNVRLLVSERERCAKTMRALRGLEVYPSEANFILFRVKEGDANRVHERLMRKGFVLRNLADVPGIENCLRVTIGTPEVNHAFLKALESAL